MAPALLDPLRHNVWATRTLLAFCRRLDPGQLRASAVGTYGSILATLQHIVGAEGRYRLRLSGVEPGWRRRPEETEDLDELAGMMQDMAGFWDRLASAPFDPDRTVHAVYQETGEAFEVKAGVLVAQALNHGNEHRAQVSTILTTLGLEPPALDGWAYGEATGRFRIEPAGEGAT